LSNAIKFTDSGAVELEARASGDRTLILTVSDSGPGIRDCERQRLFERFQQLGARSAHHSGSGLGLSISQRLVTIMGGDIECLPRTLPGSSFRVRLPGLLREPGGPPSNVLFQGLRIDTELAAPERRSVHRLARRWRMIHRRRVAVSDQPGDLLLIDPRVRFPLEQGTGYSRMIYLNSPFSVLPDDWREAPDLIELSWPLTERSFLTAVLAARMTRNAPPTGAS
jgi:hypothetical protein